MKKIFMLCRTIKMIVKNRIWLREKYVLLIGTEDFGNLGDHQIAESEIEFINFYFPMYRIIEIPASVFYKLNWSFLKRYVGKDVQIFITGGGNWGDDYLFSHNIKRSIIRDFPQNPKVVFPVSINYTNTDRGKNILEEDILLLNNVKRFILAVRDQKSYDFARVFFINVELCLMPDIVLFSNREDKRERKGCIMCIRNDKESVLSFEERKQIMDEAQKKFSVVENFDTQYEYNISVSQRKEELKKVFNRFSEAECVITDRLHGTIFSVITGTTCIVFENKNGKNSGVWNWIGNKSNSYFVHNIEEYKSVIKSIDLSSCMIDYKRDRFRTYYDCFYVQIIRELYD